MTSAPRRALQLSIEVEADTMPHLCDQLLDIAGKLHDMGRLGTIPESQLIVLDGDGTYAKILIRCDRHMTPERYRLELRAHQDAVYRQGGPRG